MSPRFHLPNSAAKHLLAVKWLTLLCLMAQLDLTVGQSGRDSFREEEFRRRYNEAVARRRENLCPYIQLGSEKVPLLTWMCGTPKSRLTGKHSYDCCPGYSRSALVNNQCVFVERSWLSIVDFLNQAGRGQTAEALQFNSAIPDLAANPSKEAYTVFVPRADAELNTGELDYARTPNAARMLVHKGRLYARDFKNGATVPNEHGVNMKITAYSTGLVFIECRLFMNVDQEAENGLIHSIDGPLPATFSYRDVMSRLQSNPDISDFVRALPTDVKTALSQPNSAQWYTVFAPSNGAWSNAVERLASPSEIASLARQHVLKKMLCSRAVTQQTSKVGLANEEDSIRMNVREDGTTYIVDDCSREINFVKRDLMSQNGVVHEIDRAISSYKTLGLNAILECLATSAESKVKEAAKQFIGCQLNLQQGSQKVVLLPTDKVISSLPRELAARLRDDARFRCDVYAYAVLTPAGGEPFRLDQRGFNQERSFVTGYKTGQNQPTHVTSTYVRYRTGSQLNFNNAKATDIHGEVFRDGVIYSIDKLNIPPSRTLRDIVKQEPKAMITTQKVESTDMFEEWQQQSPRVLFLAPVDNGWKGRNENAFTNKQTKDLLRLHTIPRAVFGGKDGFVWRHTIRELPTLLPDGRGGNVDLIVKRHLDGSTFIGHKSLPEKAWAMVVKWDEIGTDGLVWFIDWPIACPPNLCL